MVVSELVDVLSVELVDDEAVSASVDEVLGVEMPSAENADAMAAASGLISEVEPVSDDESVLLWAARRFERLCCQIWALLADPVNAEIDMNGLRKINEIASRGGARLRHIRYYDK